MSFTQTLNAREFETERSFEFLGELIEDGKSLGNYYSYPDNPLYVIFVFDKNICKNGKISEEDSPNLFKKALASHFQTKAPLPDDFECPGYKKEELAHSAIVVSKAWLEEDKTGTNTQVIPKEEKPYKLFDELLQLHKKGVNKALQLHFEGINAFFECIQKSCKSVEELLGKFWIFPDDENKLLKPINISIKEENEKTIVSLPNFPYIIVEAENEADAKAKLLETLKHNFDILKYFKERDNNSNLGNDTDYYEFLVSIFGEESENNLYPENIIASNKGKKEKSYEGGFSHNKLIHYNRNNTKLSSGERIVSERITRMGRRDMKNGYRGSKYKQL